MADIRYLISVDAAGAVKSVKNFDETLTDLAKKSDTAKAAHGGLWKEIALGQFAYNALRKAGQLALDFLKDSIKGAIDEEASEAALASALDTTGRSREKMLPGLMKYAELSMGVTTRTHEEVEASLALLAQLTNLDEKGLKQAAKGAIGLAAVTGGDLLGATRAVALGYEGNFMALGRLVPAIRSAKTESEKYAAMVDFLEKAYGRAEAETKTFGGSLKQLSISWDELKETVGGAVIKNESVRKAVQDLNVEVTKISKSDDFKLWLSAVVDGLVWAGKAAGTFARMCKEMTEDVFRATKADADLKESKWKLADALDRAKAAGHDFNQRQKESAEYSKQVKAALDAEKPSVDNLGAALKRTAEIVETKFVPSGQKMKWVLDAISPTITETAIPAARDLTAVLQDLGMKGFEPLPGVAESSMSEVSTIVADAQREIAKSILGVFDLHALLIGEAEEFDDSYYKNMMEAADAAYESTRSQIQDQLDAVKAASSEEMEAIRKKYDEALDAARAYFDELADKARESYDEAAKIAKAYFDKLEDEAREYYGEAQRLAAKYYDELEKQARKSFDAQELKISRREEDEDRRYKRAYDRDRKRIEDSDMTDKEKQQALLMLEEFYERERIARERKREDEKIKRQEAHEKKLEQIRERARQREHQLATQLANKLEQLAERRSNKEHQLAIQLQNRLEQLANQREAREHQLMNQKEKREGKAADRRAAAELDLMTKLLGLQKTHDTDVDNLRAAEDLARQKHADDEEKRQRSLWTNVKIIFATAIEEIATTYLTKFIGKILPGFGDIEEGAKKAGKTITDKLGGNLKGVADIAGKMSGGFLSALGSVGSIISGITGLIELLKGPQKATDVTYWLKLQWELLQEIHDFLFIDVRHYVLQGMYDMMGQALIKQDTGNAYLYSILPGQFTYLGNFLQQIESHTKSAAESLKALKPTKAASGFDGIVSSPRLFLAGESGPERVSITPTGGSAYAPARVQGGASVVGRPITIPVSIYLGGRLLKTEVIEIVNAESNLGGLKLNPKCIAVR